MGGGGNGGEGGGMGGDTGCEGGKGSEGGRGGDKGHVDGAESLEARLILSSSDGMSSVLLGLGDPVWFCTGMDFCVDSRKWVE